MKQVMTLMNVMTMGLHWDQALTMGVGGNRERLSGAS